jgi:hypothetical protein
LPLPFTETSKASSYLLSAISGAMGFNLKKDLMPSDLNVTFSLFAKTLSLIRTSTLPFSADSLTFEVLESRVRLPSISTEYLPKEGTKLVCLIFC